ncbi:MAG TPA: divergent polysaccharide deacetylase family protein [Rhizobiaceae bacterium]|nr:divergent polysaccharide deacetylase family protein [Rhizobiaceae bacterium]
MSHTIRDIDRPLGQNLKVRAPGRKLSVPAGSAALSMLALGLIAASGAIALRDKPYRMPVTAAVAVEEPIEKAETTALAPVPSTKAGRVNPSNPSGPSIIHVNPDGAASGNGVVIIRDPSAVGQNLRVAHLPDKALIEDTEIGPLPVRAADGRRPMDVYARPWSGARGARVAIVVGGLGLSQTGTQAAIDRLPGEVTLGFAPDGNSIGRWMQTARRKGHELVMQLPLEPFDYPNVNPGRNTLTVDASAEENIDHLYWTLSRTTNYTGVMNYMGARFSADGAAMAPIMEELGKRGLLYLDDGSSARSVAPDMALKSRVPVATGDATIDGVRERSAILDKLDELERIARAKGYAIGTASAFDVTVDAVSSWVEEAKKRGIEIVPISALVSDPERG